MNSARFTKAIAASLVCSSVLIGCTGPDSHSERNKPSATVTRASTAHVQQGVSTCTLPGKFGTATLRETPSDYRVTFAGSFYEQHNLLTHHNVVYPQVQLREKSGKDVFLVAQWDGEHLVFTGIIASGKRQGQEAKTRARIAHGAFTAAFSKSIGPLHGLTVTGWNAKIDWAPGSKHVDTHACNDGRLLPWKSLD